MYPKSPILNILTPSFKKKKTVEQLLPSWHDDEMLSGVVDYKHDDLEFFAVHSGQDPDHENIRLIDAREWKDGEWHVAY